MHGAVPGEGTVGSITPIASTACGAQPGAAGNTFDVKGVFDRSLLTGKDCMESHRFGDMIVAAVW